MRTPAVGLVGRAAEWASMCAGLAAARAGQSTVVLVSGEAGIGKTRLVEELVATAAAEDWLCAVGNCSPVSGTRLPYGPVVDLLGEVFRLRPDLPTALPAEVWRSAGALIGAVSEPPPTAGPDVASARLFAAVVQVVTTLSRDRPALLVVEDLHWADPASVDLLCFLVRKLSRVPVLLVLTHRPVDQGTVRAALVEIRRLGAVDVRLSPLPDDAMAALLDALPRPPVPEVRERITAVCGGLAFFALHWAQHGTGNEVPPGLRDVLLASLDGLVPGARQLIVTLAVMADPVDGALVRAASAADADRYVRDLIGRGLLTDRDGSLCFRHALLREVVADDTFSGERAEAHRWAADALLRSPPAERVRRAGEIAHHLQRCGRRREALRWALSAARQASAVYAFADADRLYAQVRDLWRAVDQPAAAAGVSRAGMLLEAAAASRWCGRLDQALGLLDEAPDDASGRHDSLDGAVARDGLDSAATGRERVDLEVARGQVLWATGDAAGSLRAYQRAAALLPEDIDDGTRAAVLGSLARGLVATGNATRAVQTAGEAARLAASAGADGVRCAAAITRGAALAQLGRVDEAVAELRACLPDCRRLDDLELVLRCYGNLTFALGAAGRYAEIIETATEAAEVCRRYGPVTSLASTVVNNHVEALIATGRWARAVEVAVDALGDAAESGVALHLRSRLIDVALARGDVAEADRHLALVGDVGAGNPYVVSSVSRARAERALLLDRPREAAEMIAGLLPRLQTQDDPLPVLHAAWVGLRAVVAMTEAAVPVRRSSGHRAEAEAFLAAAVAAADRTDVAAADALLIVCRAEAARLDGTDRPDQWAAAAAAFAALHRPHDHGYCLVRLGAAQLRAQARTAAAGTLTDALRVAHRLDAGPLIAEISLLTEVADLRLAVDPPADPATEPVPDEPVPALTPRERQVLALLTKGATNRMIARSLYITERTAGVHVHHILGKLGVANRTEAARIAWKRGLDRE